MLVLQGGAEEGSKLLKHSAIKKWFMTGDVRTANRILFGSPESPFKDREPGTVTFEEMDEKMVLKKPFTIELGSCSPYIIAPGEWTDRELYRHARVRLNNSRTIDLGLQLFCIFVPILILFISVSIYQCGS